MTNPQSTEQRARIAYSDAVHAQNIVEAAYNSAHAAFGTALAELRTAMAETNARWDEYKVHLEPSTPPAADGEDESVLAPFGTPFGE